MFSLRMCFFVAVVIASHISNMPAIADHLCKSPEILTADTGFRHAGGSHGQSACYRLEVYEPGLLLLDLNAVDGDVYVDLGNPKGFQVLARSASEFLVQAKPGQYTFKVRAEDPNRPLPAHRLSTRLLPVTPSQTDDSDTDGELELEPEKSDTDGELELEPEKSDTDGELELEPEKMDACAAVRSLFETLCQLGSDPMDDHGDTLTCARAINRTAYGDIRNGWGDDVDVFRFELKEWQRIEIQTGGEITPRLTLGNDRGETLGVDDGRLARTLGSGTYFLRLDAPFENGAYSLQIETLDR